MTSRLGSVVIAAYDEEALIGRCLDHLLRDFAEGELEVVVAANGCSDGTARVARTFPVHVLELDQASKAAALRAGDDAVTSFPRIYLDADVLLPSASARAVLAHLQRPDALAARPPLAYDTSCCSALVRSYYRARRQLPSMTTHLWGAGVYALSDRGRARFGAFPDVTADDLFVDQQFACHEKTIVEAEPVVVLTARTAKGLLQVLRRQNRGKRNLGHGQHVQPTSRVYADLLALARGGASLAVDAAIFAAFATASRCQPLAGNVRWERDTSSRLGNIPSPRASQSSSSTEPGAQALGQHAVQDLWR